MKQRQKQKVAPKRTSEAALPTEPAGEEAPATLGPRARPRGIARSGAPPSKQAQDSIPPSSSLRPCRVLVVDDSTFSRMNLRGLLEENGHQVVGEAHNADEALALYRQTRPDLVTMDLNMPEKTGIDAMREISGVDPKASFIIVTALDQKLVWDECKRMGACEFVSKPVEWKNLRSAIVRVLRAATPGS